MAIAKGAVGLLLEEAKRRPFVGSLATLGRMTIIATAAQIAQQFNRFGFANRPPGGAIDDNALFSAMGFSEVESFDVSGYEGAHVFDLNSDHLPAAYEGAFDVVLDCGTIEHVFNFANGLRNAVKMAKVGGRLIFLTPSANVMDHGYYGFSPMAFFDFFTANRFSIETFYILRHTAVENAPIRAYAYTSESWSDLNSGSLDGAIYSIFVVATRTLESTSDTIPQQRTFADVWKGQAGAGRSQAYRRAKSLIGHIPGAPMAAMSLRRRLGRVGIRRLRYVQSY